MSIKKTLPNTNAVGKELETQGMVEFGKRAYQTDNNCFEIACTLAKRFGYIPPVSREEFMDMNRKVYDEQAKDRYFRAKGDISSPPRLAGYPLQRSPAYLIARMPQSMSVFFGSMHVTFELYGKEYNFGPGEENGFEIGRRIPLFRRN